MSEGLKKAFAKPMVWALVGLLAVLLFDLFFVPGFFQFTVRDGRIYGSIVDIFNRAAPVTLLGLGMTLVIATFGIDLSVGAVMAIAGAAAANNLVSKDPNVGVAISIGLGLALLCGFFNGFLVSVVKIQPIVATLILMVAGRGIAQLMTNGTIVTFENAGFEQLGSGGLLGLPTPVVIAAAALGLLALLTRQTAFGTYLEAVGSNPKASILVGIRPGLVKFWAYTLCGVLAGVAGLVACADIKAADANNVGLYMELDAILAVTIGGTSITGGRFSLVGTVLGALFIQALTTTILTTGVPKDVTLVVKALVIVVVCLLQGPEFWKMLRGSKAVAA